MPSRPPRSGSVLWALVLPVLLLLVGVAWAYSKVDFGHAQPVGVESAPPDAN